MTDFVFERVAYMAAAPGGPINVPTRIATAQEG
jgi:hypothetical protein